MPNIDSLLQSEKALTKGIQSEYVSIIKRNIKKHGLSEKTRQSVKKDLTALGSELTKNALKLGVRWLNG